MIKLVLPKTEVETFGEKSFFLAGPIQSAGDWQKRAVEMLYAKAPEAFIFCPCRYKDGHPLYPHSVSNWMEQSDHGVYRKGNFESQTVWERRYLEASYRDGCNIFWLPAEDHQNPRIDGSPYARDTYGELGEWRGRLWHDTHSLTFKLKQRLVIGAEPGFPGLKQIKTNFKEMLGRRFVFHETLESTIEAAVSVGLS